MFQPNLFSNSYQHFINSVNDEKTMDRVGYGKCPWAM